MQEQRLGWELEFHLFAAARSEIWRRRGVTRVVHKMH